MVIGEIKIMATKPANAAQKQWMADITYFIMENGLGDLYGCDYIYDVRMQRHHVLGRSAKHNKVAIGHWFVIAIPFELHDPNVNHAFHVGKCKKAFVKRFGTQRSIFKRMYQTMKQQGYKVPDIDVYNAIMDTAA